MELAIGWPSGLHSLLDVGFSADAACTLSIHMDDLRSTEIIFAAESFPRAERAWTNALRESNESSQQIEEVVVQALARRRQALAELAIK